MSEVRNFRADDVPAVAAMFQRTFRDPQQPAPESLGAHIKTVFLDHPWQDPEISSRVHVSDQGKINGFIGVLPLRMMVDGSPKRAGVAGSLMVDSPKDDPLAGAKLLRAFLNGPQDLSISETANPLSQRMWERIGGQTLGALSVDWIRVFRPAAAAIELGSGRIGPLRWLRPLARLLDLPVRRLAAGFFKAAAADSFAGAEVDNAEIAARLLELTNASPVRPNWDAASLRWFLDQAEVKEQRGPLHRRVVRRANGSVVGCVLYYGAPRGVAWVLQIVAAPGFAQGVVDELFAHADREGLAAIRGRISPATQEALLLRNTLLYRRAATVAHSRDPRLIEAIGTSEAVVNGLAGESWIRLIGGVFG